MIDHHSDESESEDDESGDGVGEIHAPAPKPVIVKGRRTSVSAETIDPSRYILIPFYSLFYL